MNQFHITKCAFALLISASLLSALTGCHSGTVRGVGSDMEELGHEMQK